MGSYLQTVWRCRYFWMSLVHMDLRTRYRGSVLGIGWSLLQPLAMTAILCTVFVNLFHQDITTYAPYVLVGLSFWTFILSVNLMGCSCFRLAESYIRQYPAPLAIYSLRNVLVCAFHFLVALSVVVCLATFLMGNFNPLALLTLIPTIFLLLVVGWAMSTMTGLLNVQFPDTRHLAEVSFQALFYLTPIIYPPDALRSAKLESIFMYNPLVYFLDLLRLPILHGQVPKATTFLVALLVTAGLFTLAAYMLKRTEKTFIFYL